MGGSGKRKKGKQKKSSNPNIEDSTSCDFEHLISVNMANMNRSETPTSSGLQQIYCSDDELEHLTVTKLLVSYSRSFSSMFSCGYSPEDVVNSVMTTERRPENIDIQSGGEDRYRAHKDLLAFVQESLTAMVHCISEARPSLSRGDVMWCLFMTNFDLGFAKTLHLPAKTNDGIHVLTNAYIPNEEVSYLIQLTKGMKAVDDDGDDDNNTKCSIKKLDELLEQNLDGLKPSYEPANLRRSVEAFVAMCRHEIKETPEETQALEDLYHSEVPSTGLGIDDRCMVNTALTGLAEEKPGAIARLVDDIERAEECAKERKEWAQKRVAEAAKRLGRDLLELKSLKMENKGYGHSETGAAEEEERSMKILAARQNALGEMAREASQWKQAAKNEEIKHAEMNAEMEAFKLRSSESNEKLKQVLKKEKKLMKTTTALEKQNMKLENDIGEHRAKSLVLQQELVHFKQANEDVLVMLRKEVEAKEVAVRKLKEEQKSKEELEVRIQRGKREIRQEMKTNSLKYKYYMELLERNIANLEAFQEASDDTYHLPDYLFSWESESSKAHGDASHDAILGTCEQKDLSKQNMVSDRACIYCFEKEASVVFLPCAHQVLCGNCNEDHYKYAASRCPCCMSLVEQRIHVFGVRS